MENREDLDADNRKKRIAKMKSGIIITISSWMLISFVAIIVLTVCVININNKLNRSFVSIPNTSEATNSNNDMYSNIVTGIDSVDNMASEGDKHYVYLTFDGSPSSNTDEILDILATYDVKATFFVVGNEEEQMKSVYQRIVNEGHSLGMHSYSNQFSLIYKSTDAFTKDMNQLRDYLYNVTGVKSLYYRFPGGSGNQISDINMVDYVRVLKANNITYFDWNVSAGDSANDYSIDDVVSNVIAGVSDYKTSIVLLHDADNKSTTVKALGPLIEALEKMDAEILPIDENTNIIQYIHADSVE